MTVGKVAVTPLVDHTLLRASADRVAIEQLCDEAAEHRFAAVCVNSCWVEVASGRLMGTDVRVCSTVGFPLGATTSTTKAAETRAVLDAGGTEVDMVVNLGALKTGDWGWVRRDIDAVVDPCRDRGAVVKVIIETALLTDTEKRVVSALAVEAGAAYVKTSTGFGPGGATVKDVALIRAVVGAEVGVKAAGGIRDIATARAMVLAGANRIGTSAGVRIAREEAGRSL